MKILKAVGVWQNRSFFRLKTVTGEAASAPVTLMIRCHFLSKIIFRNYTSLAKAVDFNA